MSQISNKELIEKAKSVINPRRIKHGCKVGNVGCALITDRGNIFLGVSIDTCCGMGFCAEHSAIAAMITNGELKIRKIVAVVKNGMPIPPCGRCREFIRQVHEENINAEVLLGEDKLIKLKDLLPVPFDTKD